MMDVAYCERCGARYRVAGPGNEDARLLRHAAEAKGFCATCAAHDWLMTIAIGEMLNNSGPRMLLLPHIREQFAAIMLAGNADAKPDEINWNLMVENWDLPFPKASAKRHVRDRVQSPAEIQRKLKAVDDDIERDAI
jgi:hypothetical protein